MITLKDYTDNNFQTGNIILDNFTYFLQKHYYIYSVSMEIDPFIKIDYRVFTIQYMLEGHSSFLTNSIFIKKYADFQAIYTNYCAKKNLINSLTQKLILKWSTIKELEEIISEFKGEFYAYKICQNENIL